MTILLTPPSLKRNYIDAGFSGILVILEALSPTGPNIPNVLSNLKAGFGALKGTPEDATGNRAWVWAFKTLSYAAAEVLKNERQKAPLSVNKDEAVREFLEASAGFDGQELDPLALMNPGASEIFFTAREKFGPMLLKATTSTSLDLPSLEQRFMTALRVGSNRTLCENPQYFRVLEDGLTGLAGEGARRDGHWARHAHWISHYFTDAPIFSPDEDEIIPLEAVYLPLRCFWHKITQVAADDGTKTEVKTADVENLHGAAHRWLRNDVRQNPILIVTGGPGSGKSSFARAFAHEVIQSGKHRVLFIQLQHMSLTGSLREDIARYVQNRDLSVGINGSPGLPGNPFDWRKTDDQPLLLVFDGLDELSTKEEDGERYSRNLLLDLKFLLAALNTEGPAVRALVMGRNLACQAAMKVANIALEHLLNVAPISELTHEAIMMPSSSTDIHDPDNLMELDQRQSYWKNWAKLTGKDPDNIPEALTAQNMQELNVEPLLLHLLMISKYCGDEWEKAADNKNVVYEDILQKIFKRNEKKSHFKAEGMDEPTFFEFMECLGIAAWRGNGRTGDEIDFRQVRKLHLNREKEFKEYAAARLESVALNIHTRAGTDQTDESFGEYLAARGLLSHTRKIATSLLQKDPEDVELAWSQIISSAELTTEIIHFLNNEARKSLTTEVSLPLKNSLTELINWVVTNGFSTHKVSPELSWSELATRQRCAISALIASTSAITSTIPIEKWSQKNKELWTYNIQWPKAESRTAAKLLNTIHAGFGAAIARGLCRINLSNQQLWNASLVRTNLEGADLRHSMMPYAVLSGVNLEHANLELAIIQSAQFYDTDLSNSRMRGVDLAYSNFESVSMRGCDLSYANLRKVNATKVNTPFYTDRNTNFLEDCSIDLEGADLANADLTDADLSGVVNLTTEALNSAICTKSTVLPEYINRSEVNILEESDYHSRLLKFYAYREEYFALQEASH